jgi:hypothetical protein
MRASEFRNIPLNLRMATYPSLIVISYGPMGVAIINSTLALIFKDRSTAALNLKTMFEDLVEFKITNAKTENDRAFWKGADSSSLTLNDFLDFVVQPFVANLLIMKDLDVTETKAEEIRTTSRKYGLRYNFETDDGRVDKISMDYMTSSKVYDYSLCMLTVEL